MFNQITVKTSDLVSYTDNKAAGIYTNTTKKR